MAAIVATRRWRPSLTVAVGILAAAPAADAAVELEGVEGPLRTNVLAYMTLDDQACDAAERVVRQEYRTARDEITQALQAYGYYQASIQSDLSFEPDCWSAGFTIEPGRRVMLRRLDLELAGEAQRDAPFSAAFGSLALAAGDGLDHGVYERAKRRLLDLARDRGYPEAEFTSSRIDIYPQELAADVELRFDSGPRYRFGEVTLMQEALRDEFVRSFIGIESGTPYTSRALTETYAALNDSGHFQTIDVRAGEPDPLTQAIPVEIRLTTAPRRLISYGVGFSTDTGPRLRFGRMIRRWNDRGHQFGLNAQLSPVMSEVLANYRFPYGDPRFEWISLDGGIAREDTDTSSSESLEFGARRVLERPGSWSRVQLVSLLVEDFEVGDQEGRSRLLMPGMDWRRIRADNTLRPRRGSKVEFQLRGAGDALGSDTSFVQLVTELRWISTLANDGRVLLRGRFGATAMEDFDQLPPSVRFFAGGDNSIRGYGFEELGPVDHNGEVIGGPRLAVASVEYEHPVKPRWSVAVFVDAGNAFERSDFDVKTGAGIGARWLSPLGPVRIDIGVPVNDPEQDARIHVSLGPDL